MTSFDPNYLFKDPVSKFSHILKSLGLGLQHMNFGDTIQPIRDVYLIFQNKITDAFILIPSSFFTSLNFPCQLR